ncbi:hypothetical protein D3C78_765230 [compost metagenome]
MQIDRQRIDALAARRLDAVLVGHERLEAVHIVPDFLVVGMEDMRTVNMHHDASLTVAFGVAIAGNVVAGVDDVDHMACQCKLPANDCAGKPGAHNDNSFVREH